MNEANKAALITQQISRLGNDPEIRRLAHCVYPTWLTAHGHIADRGIEHLIEEIAQCITAIEWTENWDHRHRAIGNGITVTKSGSGEYEVTVVAGRSHVTRLKGDQ